ncbi:hypothetical protein [Runella sp. SP2]|uniref:hypothetical protein n=1 Tax=Runella sp. SP2 TaxID=2268026 RepID=UPI000F0785D2|nr:hypothetical protein [Runella sp. SP2]AYQ33803.1 hypothetical protein DTQ70_17310 [Runella sp. SP2]
MNNAHYILENGVLEIQEQQFFIDDTEKKTWKTEVLFLLFFVILGSVKVGEGIKKDDYFKLFLGVGMLGVAAFSIFVNRRRTTTQAEVSLADIEKIEIHKKRPDKWLAGLILLKNKKVRTIHLNEDFDKARFIEDMRLREIPIVLK